MITGIKNSVKNIKIIITHTCTLAHSPNTSHNLLPLIRKTYSGIAGWADVHRLAIHSTVSLRPAIMAALIPPLIGNVMIQAKNMLRNSFQSTLDFDLTRPTKTTLPTLQCVVLTGIPIMEATNTVSADPISIQKPLQNNETCMKSSLESCDQ